MKHRKRDTKTKLHLDKWTWNNTPNSTTKTPNWIGQSKNVSTNKPVKLIRFTKKKQVPLTRSFGQNNQAQKYRKTVEKNIAILKKKRDILDFSTKYFEKNAITSSSDK